VFSYGIPNNIISNKILSHIIKKVYTHCDNILVSSKNFEKTIREYVNKPIAYIPNWLESSENEKCSISFESDCLHFTFTGNISLYQNLINVIKGFNKANIENSRLHIIGDGSSKNSIEKLIQDNDLKNIILHGRYPYDEMKDIMDQSDFLILSLIKNDGIEKTEPLKLQSYLSSGKPILGILNGSCKDIIEENEIGVCTSPDNIDDIANGFHSIIEFSKNQKDFIKQRTENLLNTRFNKDQIIKRINSTMNLE
jgi:glycosyltransferase involved in cell wall biosynthesis